MLGLVPVWRTEAYLGVEVAASRINAGFVEYMRLADEMLQPFLVKGRGGRSKVGEGGCHAIYLRGCAKRDKHCVSGGWSGMTHEVCRLVG